MSETIIATEELGNGLVLNFHDQGNRYFGDYHQVKVLVSCRIELNDRLVSEHLPQDELARARQIFGDQLEYRRVLKQMGVAGDALEAAKRSLVENFIRHTASYMNKPDFPSRLVARRLAEHRNRSRLHLVGHD